MLFGIDAAIVYLKVSNLFILYHIYIVPAYVISRITQLAIPYMLILTTLERFVWISGEKTKGFLKRMFSDRGHQITVFLLLLCCTISRLPTAFAIVVHHFPNCNDFLRTQSTGPADWVQESDVYYFFDFHLLSIAQTFIPFIVLVVFNFIIVRKLPKANFNDQKSIVKESNQENGHQLLKTDFIQKHQQLQQELSVPNACSVTYKSNRNSSIPEHKPKSSSTIRGALIYISKKSRNFHREKRNEIITVAIKPQRKMSKPVRDAICTMFAIVTSYLISNSLHLILTILERSQISILRDPDDPMMASTFHTIFSDTVSFVYMFTSAIRIIIYTCNPAIRSHLREFLRYGRKRSTPTMV
uniref:G-protein coupled receptors family 1 profile domain-containing protein n=1 Tax=Setaria digitata TaxID=48799 RepID=A0A915PRV2_9BILA